MIADDLAAGDLAVLRLADLVWNALPGQLFFVASNCRDFRDRMNTLREKFGRVLSREAKGMTCGETSLFHGC